MLLHPGGWLTCAVSGIGVSGGVGSPDGAGDGLSRETVNNSPISRTVERPVQSSPTLWRSGRWLSLGGRPRICPRMRAAATPTRVRLLSRPVCHCAVRASGERGAVACRGMRRGYRGRRIKAFDNAGALTAWVSPAGGLPVPPHAPAYVGDLVAEHFTTC